MPKQVDHQERREHIAAALMRVATEHGLESVSLRRVAEEAGVTAGMVQHYFSSKDSMMRFAMDTASDRYEQRMNAAIAALGEGPSPRDLVGAVLGTLLPTTEPGATADGRVALAFLAYAASRPAVAADLERSNAGLREFVTDNLRQASSLEPESTAAMLVALTDGLGVQMLSSNLSHQAAAGVLQAQLDLAFSTGRSRERA